MEIEISTSPVGNRFGWLTVVDEVEGPVKIGNGKWNPRGKRYVCRCLCGAVVNRPAHSLIKGTITSCGCVTKTRIYQTWRHAKERCEYKKGDSYRWYGEKGIKMCEEWSNNFFAFFNYMGPIPPGCTLDRIDPNKNYEPGNCRWATWDEQAANRRSTKLSSELAERIRLRLDATDEELSAEFGVGTPAINLVRNGKRWKAHKMVPEDFEKAIAALVAWKAAEGNKTAAEAVLYVIKRQADDLDLGWMRAVEIAREHSTNVVPDPKNPDFQHILQIVDLVYDGVRRDRLTNLATAFSREPKIGSEWILTATVGPLFFYRRKQ